MLLIIPFFIMNRGCPHRCIFCNQQKVTGPHPEDISEDFFRETVATFLRHTKKTPDEVQIAFYGGNFTGMPPYEQIRMLLYAKPYLESGLVHSIRISTRPDWIDQRRLDLLKANRVKVVEMGVQSMVNAVLKRTERGHTAGDVEEAVQLLKASGMQVGIHLMVGLPGDDPDGFTYSVDRIIALQPHMARIHPTLVLAGTTLEQHYRHGDYQPLQLDEAVSLCGSALKKFTAAGIPVIRIGMQTTPEMIRNHTIIAGPYHPAFRSLVESSLFLDQASLLLSAQNVQGKSIIFSISPRDLSNVRGLKNENIRILRHRHGFSEISFSQDATHPPGTLRLHVQCDVSTSSR